MPTFLRKLTFETLTCPTLKLLVNKHLHKDKPLPTAQGRTTGMQIYPGARKTDVRRHRSEDFFDQVQLKYGETGCIT
jgi:hypothetical protein